MDYTKKNGVLVPKQRLFAPMLSTFGGGSARGFNPGGSAEFDIAAGVYDSASFSLNSSLEPNGTDPDGNTTNVVKDWGLKDWYIRFNFAGTGGTRWGNPATSRKSLSTFSNFNRTGSNSSSDTLSLSAAGIYGSSVNINAFEDGGFNDFYTDTAGFGLGAIYNRWDGQTGYSFVKRNGAGSFWDGDGKASFMSITFSSNITDVLIGIGNFTGAHLAMELVDRSTNAKKSGTDSLFLGGQNTVDANSPGLLSQTGFYNLVYTNIPSNSAFVLGEGAGTAGAIAYVCVR